MKPGIPLWGAVVLAMMAAMPVCVAERGIPGQSQPTRESAAMQLGTYDPSFWVFGYALVEHLQLMKDLGFAGVGYYAALRDGDSMKYFFDSPTLRQFEWARASQFEWVTDSGWAPSFREYAAQAHAAGLKVMANMEDVNPDLWPAGRKNWTPGIISNVMTELRSQGADRWFTECVQMVPPLFLALADTGRKIGIEYQEGADPWWIHVTDADTGQGFVELYRRAHMVSMYHYHFQRDEVGKLSSLAQEGSLAYGFARGWGLPTAMIWADFDEEPEDWEGVLKPSIAVRALQFRVRDIMLIGMNEARARQLDIAGTKQWVSDLVARNAEEKRPLLNIVAYWGKGDEGAHSHDLVASGDAITSGAFHAGWDVVASTAPLPNADAYYVYTAGKRNSGTLDLTPDIAELFKGSKPVFLQIGATIPGGGDLTPNWRQALSACGVNPETAFSEGDMPARGEYRGASFTYTGIFTAFEVEERRHGTLIPRSAVTGTVSAEGDGVPLIVSNGNKHLIPANCIRWQVMYPISDLLAGCGVRPSSDVWGIAGEKVTVLLATHDTQLEMVIPKLAKGATIRVTQWDRRHQISYQDIVTYAGSYRRSMKQFDSIVIEAL